MPTTTVFFDGDDQCVVLPDGFTFIGDEVWISQDGDQVVLEPIRDDDPPAPPDVRLTSDYMRPLASGG